jgi:hypothetical protein
MEKWVSRKDDGTVWLVVKKRGMSTENIAGKANSEDRIAGDEKINRIFNRRGKRERRVVSSVARWPHRNKLP